jgi:lysyl-tRNA synthetase class 1
MHWADVVAHELKERWESKTSGAEGAAGTGGEGRFTIATGITPSGHIHVGNMREVLTGDAIYRACLDLGLPARLVYLGDDMDPLRKVYPFLDESYKGHIGKPLFEIPCPCGDHRSYSEHFLEPFIAALERCGIDAEVVLVHEGYEAGRYAGLIRKMIAEKDRARSILAGVSGRDMPDDWFPYTPKCSACGRFADAVPTGFVDPHVLYTCGCGHAGKADINTAGGKLPWRLEWPARWSILDVFCEPFGKDHAAAGGSYDSGSAIMRDILGREPPHPLVYEWIQLKGVGVMASSTGVVVTAADMLGMTPPEVLRYLIMRTNPAKHIDFDPGLGILSLVDEYDRLERLYYGFEEGVDPEDQRRAFELSQVDRMGVQRMRKRAGLDDKLRFKSGGPGAGAGPEPIQVAYKHMVTLTQVAPGWDGVKGLLERTGQLEAGALEGPEGAAVEAGLRARLDAVAFWLEKFAPDMVKFSVQKSIPPDVLSGLDDETRGQASAILETLREVPWTADAIHTGIYDAAEKLGVKGGRLFQLMYQLFLGQKKGPRLGYFLNSLEREFVLVRLEEAAASA